MMHREGLHGFSLLVLLGFSAQVDAKVLEENHTNDAWDSKGQLGVESDDTVINHLVNNLANKYRSTNNLANNLANLPKYRRSKVSPLSRTEIDGTMLGKPGLLATSARAKPIVPSPSFRTRHVQKLAFDNFASPRNSHQLQLPKLTRSTRSITAVPQGSQNSLRSINTRAATPLANVKDKTRKPLAKQQNGVVPTSLSICLFVWAIAQEVMSPAGMHMDFGAGLSTLVVSYLIADYWLWMLHCFLDREENLKSKIGFVAFSANEFQEHHDKPKQVLEENHIKFTDDIITGVAGMALVLGHWTSPAAKLIALGVILFGRLGGLNHYYCHAVTHGYEVPAFYKYGQKWGLLPTAKNHQQHHTPPHQGKWNFLNGLGSTIYEPMYFATGSSYAGLAAQFALLNPLALQLWAVALGILTKT